MNKRAIGTDGEIAAQKFLQKQGYKLLERNYRAQRCEIDLIMQDGAYTVFIEVKARTPSMYGGGREAVTLAKQRNIIRAALCYMRANSLMEAPVRFDVVEVDLANNGITHLPNAFQA